MKPHVLSIKGKFLRGRKFPGLLLFLNTETDTKDICDSVGASGMHLVDPGVKRLTVCDRGAWNKKNSCQHRLAAVDTSKTVQGKNSINQDMVQ